MLKLALLMLVAFPALAAEVAGVNFEDRVRVGPAQAVLNGAGLRKRVFFQVYAIGVYLPKSTSSAEEALRSAGPKRIAIHMLRDAGADQFNDALAAGIRANHSEAEAGALEPRVKQLTAIIAEVKEAKKGMSIALDWTGSATQVRIHGEPHGTAIPGEDFYRALLRIWLGEKPVQEDLKKALIGQAP